MACGQCRGNPPVPYVRRGLPTVYSWGPYADHEIVDYAELEAYGNLLQGQE